LESPLAIEGFFLGKIFGELILISKIPKWIWLGVALLAFNAGFINAIAFLSFSHQAVTHLTGNLSIFSITLFKQNISDLVHLSLLIFSFLTGAILSGIIILDPHLQLGRSYGRALFLESFLLFLAVIGFSQGALWGEYLASMACGLQNAMVSSYSGAIIRTTHMTGIMTDLGRLLGNYLRKAEVDFRKIKLFSLILFSFVSGGVLGAAFFHSLNHLALLVPAALIFILGIIYTAFIPRTA
jgi:uncharacterized membrane protein YoaK (UPF0700 family)